MSLFSSVERPRTGIVTKLFYGFGSVAYGVKDNGFSAFLMLFYNQVLGLPAAWVGTAIMIALAVDSVLDPIVGHISDNWTSRWGRRHPFMYFAAIPAAVAFLFLWMPPAGLSQVQLFVYLLVMAIVVRTLITLYEIPSTALGAELSENYDQRTSVFGFRFFFGWWGGLTLTIIALGVLLVPDAQHPVGQLNPAGYARYGLVSSLIMASAILISAAGTHRFIAHLKPAASSAAFHFGEWIEAMKGTFANPSFRAIMASALFTSMSGGLALAMNAYFVTFLWELSNAQYAVMLGSAFIGSFIALITSPYLSKTFGKKPATITLYVLSAIIGPMPLILRLLGLFPDNESSLLIPLLFGSTAMQLTFSINANILGTSMIADIAEDIEIKTGKRSEGLLFSASSVIAKAVSGVGIFATGMILSFVDFPANAKPGQVPIEVLDKLLLTYLPISALLHLFAILALTGYRISRAQHEDNLEQLARRQEP